MQYLLQKHIIHRLKRLFLLSGLVLEYIYLLLWEHSCHGRCFHFFLRHQRRSLVAIKVQVLIIIILLV